MRSTMVGGALIVLLLNSCGSSSEQRAATFGLTGAGIGALVGGPIGLVAGAAAGGVAGAVMPIGADQAAKQALSSVGYDSLTTPASGTSTAPAPSSAPPTSAAPATSKQRIVDAQTILRNRGYYDGPIDGIVGPKTRAALVGFQAERGLPETAQLDQATYAQLKTVPNYTGSSAGGGTEKQQPGARSEEPRQH